MTEQPSVCKICGEVALHWRHDTQIPNAPVGVCHTFEPAEPEKMGTCQAQDTLHKRAGICIGWQTATQQAAGEGPVIKVTIYDPIVYLQELSADMGRRGECDICLKLEFCINVLKEKLAEGTPKLEVLEKIMNSPNGMTNKQLVNEFEGVIWRKGIRRAIDRTGDDLKAELLKRLHNKGGGTK